MTSLLGLLPAELTELVTSLGGEPYRARQLLQSLYRDGADSFEAMTQVPRTLREGLIAAGWKTGAATETARQASADGLTTKLLLKTDAGTLIETVLMRYDRGGERHPRATVCVSTQAGCAMGCVFCATGQMGFERNLDAAEVVAQVMHFARVQREREQHITNVVFMGMGEPLANYTETIRAVRILTDPAAFGLGQRAITISTVGVIRGIERLADEDLQVGLAISLHSPDNDLRKQLVPTASPHSVDDLIKAADGYWRKTSRRVTFEYALIGGVNDSDVLARDLARRLRGHGGHVNLIPVNPTAGGYGRPTRGRVLAFERILRDAGVNCTVRVEKGVEIAAACGQLRTDTSPALISLAEIK